MGSFKAHQGITGPKTDCGITKPSSRTLVSRAADGYRYLMNLTAEEIARRKPVWIAMSDLWLDNDVDEEWAKQIAAVIAESGLSEEEIDDIFTFELAPFLGWNHLTVAGEWAAFDSDWICEEAGKRVGKRRLLPKLADKTGLSTYAAKDSYNMVKRFAFSEKR